MGLVFVVMGVVVAKISFACGANFRRFARCAQQRLVLSLGIRPGDQACSPMSLNRITS